MQNSGRVLFTYRFYCWHAIRKQNMNSLQTRPEMERRKLIWLDQPNLNLDDPELPKLQLLEPAVADSQRGLRQHQFPRSLFYPQPPEGLNLPRWWASREWPPLGSCLPRPVSSLPPTTQPTSRDLLTLPLTTHLVFRWPALPLPLELLCLHCWPPGQPTELFYLCYAFRKLETQVIYIFFQFKHC